MSFVHIPITIPNTTPPPIKTNRPEDQLIGFFENLAPLLVALVALEAALAVEMTVVKLREEELVEEAAAVEVTNDVAVLVLCIVVLVVLILVFVPVVVVEVEREVDVEANVVAVESEVESEVEEVTAEDTDVDDAVDEDGMVVVSLVNEEDVSVRDEVPVEVDEIEEDEMVEIEGVLLVLQFISRNQSKGKSILTLSSG